MKTTCSIEEAAQLLGISRGYAYKLARKGELPGAFRVGMRTRVSRAELNRLTGVYSQIVERLEPEAEDD